MQNNVMSSSVNKTCDENKRNTATVRNLYPVCGHMHASDVLTNVSSLSSLLLAEKRCHRSVGYKNSVARYHLLTLSKCYETSVAMRNGTYRTGKGDSFEIFDPRYRIVTATRYKDRIPQASFVMNYFYTVVAPQLANNNFACLKNKGVDLARRTFKEILEKAEITDFALVSDFKSYFASIYHDILIDEFRNYADDEWALWYLRDIISANGEVVGITLGSEPNQLSATTLPTVIDRKFSDDEYLRYMDDIRYVNSKENVIKAYEAICEEAKRLGLTLSKKKTFIQPVTKPIKFLGFSFLKHEDGRVTMKRLPNKLNNEKRKLRRMKKAEIPFERIAQHYQCVRATMKKGTRHSLFALDKYYNNLFKEEIKQWTQSKEITKQK